MALMIGVNDQFRGRSSVADYERRFAALLAQRPWRWPAARRVAVLVLSIPDYGVTPFRAPRIGLDARAVGPEVDRFNDAARHRQPTRAGPLDRRHAAVARRRRRHASCLRATGSTLREAARASGRRSCCQPRFAALRRRRPRSASWLRALSRRHQVVAEPAAAEPDDGARCRRDVAPSRAVEPAPPQQQLAAEEGKVTRGTCKALGAMR
jgi:hypothetical protein